MTVGIGRRALRAMQCEIGRFTDRETGGVLLGYALDDELRIVEAVDGGYTGVLRESGRFMYNADYVEHVSNILSALYSPPLELVGVWHKYNHALPPVFSQEDEEMHCRLLSLVRHDVCSILFQKRENSMEYVMRTYCVPQTGAYEEVLPRIMQWSNMCFSKEE